MKSLITFVVAVLLLGFVSSARAENLQLSEPYTLTVGDWLAFQLNEMIRGSDELPPGTVVRYDKPSGVILVEIFGKRKTVKDAKQSIKDCWEFIENQHIPVMEKNYNVSLGESDYTIVYYHQKRKSGPTEVVRMVEGNLLLPQD